jgi:hypothetical protein
MVIVVFNQAIVLRVELKESRQSQAVSMCICIMDH